MKYINYREERNHGTIDFPIEFYHVTPNHPRYEMSYHWHIEYELIRVLKGKLLMSIGESEFTAEAGDLIFIKGAGKRDGKYFFERGLTERNGRVILTVLTHIVQLIQFGGTL